MEVAKANGVSGSRIMGGGFGGCTINLVKDDVYDTFVADAKKKFTAKYGHEPEFYLLSSATAHTGYAKHTINKKGRPSRISLFYLSFLISASC